ncbi:hypothetical protein FOA52_010155 [Chlamydomonas sp. UWO 241]|nr:hypothetical protein FOA52_010155 [Chlamydomonas sp. UWO 241]
MGLDEDHEHGGRTGGALGEMELEVALNKVGTGRFQLLVLLICGLANAADAIEILSVGLLGTAAEEELGLSPRRTGILSACIFGGMFVGGLSWGFLGDAIGRRPSLIAALTINALFGAMSSGAHSLFELVVLRTLAGVGVGGSVPIVFTAMSEFCSAHSRGKLLAGVASFWMVGSLTCAALGWAVIPAAGWRMFVLLASVPAWTTALLAAAFLPETPRWLLVKGKGEWALAVLRHIGQVNRCELPNGLSLRPLHVPSDEGGSDDDGPSPTAAPPRDARTRGGAPLAPLLRSGAPAAPPAGLARNSQQGLQQGQQQGRPQRRVLHALLLGELAQYTWPLIGGWVALCGGWYSMVLWLPRYFEARGATGGSIYAQTFAVAAGNLPGNLASLWLIDRLGRRLTCVVCMAAGCVAALAFAAAPAGGAWPTIAAMVFNGVSVPGWNALDAISAELYPTSVRSTGFGLLGATGRLSSLVCTYAAGELLDVALWAPLVFAAVLLAGGSACMMRLPEPAGAPLQDSIGEVQRGGSQAQQEHRGAAGQQHRGGDGGDADDGAEAALLSPQFLPSSFVALQGRE